MHHCFQSLGASVLRSSEQQPDWHSRGSWGTPRHYEGLAEARLRDGEGAAQAVCHEQGRCPGSRVIRPPVTGYEAKATRDETEGRGRRSELVKPRRVRAREDQRDPIAVVREPAQPPGSLPAIRRVEPHAALLRLGKSVIRLGVVAPSRNPRDATRWGSRVKVELDPERLKDVRWRVPLAGARVPAALVQKASARHPCLHVSNHVEQADINAPERCLDSRLPRVAILGGAMPRAATRRKRRELLRQAHSYIARSYTDPDLDLRDVAEAVGTSTRQLQRVFREEGGEDFRSYLLRIRMKRATVLLSRERNPLPIRVTARRVGYRQASGLRQAFLRFYGYNPSTIQPRAPEYLGTETFE